MQSFENLEWLQEQEGLRDGNSSKCFTSETQPQSWGVEVLEGSIAVGEAFWGKETMKIILFTPIRGISREKGYEYGLFVRFQTNPEHYHPPW